MDASLYMTSSRTSRHPSATPTHGPFAHFNLAHHKVPPNHPSQPIISYPTAMSVHHFRGAIFPAGTYNYGSPSLQILGWCSPADLVGIRGLSKDFKAFLDSKPHGSLCWKRARANVSHLPPPPTFPHYNLDEHAYAAFIFNVYQTPCFVSFTIPPCDNVRDAAYSVAGKPQTERFPTSCTECTFAVV